LPASCLPALSCTVPNTSAPPGATSLSLAAMVGGHGRWPRSSDHEFFSTFFERRGDKPRPALVGKIPGRRRWPGVTGEGAAGVLGDSAVTWPSPSSVRGMGSGTICFISGSPCW
jgi:hypothetical protein